MPSHAHLTKGVVDFKPLPVVEALRMKSASIAALREFVGLQGFWYSYNIYFLQISSKFCGNYLSITMYHFRADGFSLQDYSTHLCIF